MSNAPGERKQVLRVLDKLAKEGYLREVSDKPIKPRYGEVGPPRRNPTWKIIIDLYKRPQATLPRKNSGRSKVWRAIRAKHRFAKQDLVIITGLSQYIVDQYVRDLEKQRYIRRTGKDGRSVTYLLVKIDQVEPPRGFFKEALNTV